MILYLILYRILIGSRLGYVIFYNPIYYLSNILEIPMIWQGGMSFHGAVIGIILASILFCRKKNLEKYIFLI